MSIFDWKLTSTNLLIVSCKNSIYKSWNKKRENEMKWKGNLIVTRPKWKCMEKQMQKQKQKRNIVKKLNVFISHGLLNSLLNLLKNSNFTHSFSFCFWNKDYSVNDIVQVRMWFYCFTHSLWASYILAKTITFWLFMFNSMGIKIWHFIYNINYIQLNLRCIHKYDR